MAKVKVTNLSQLGTELRKKVTKSLRDESFRKGIGEIIVDQIQDEPVPVTSKATKAWREYLEKGNKPLSPKYDPENINITFTGEQLNDLKSNVKTRVGSTRAEFVIEHSTKLHSKYRKPNGKPVIGSRKTYKQISEFIIAKGYNYLRFSRKSKDRVAEFIQERLFELLSK